MKSPPGDFQMTECEIIRELPYCSDSFKNCESVINCCILMIPIIIYPLINLRDLPNCTAFL